jgi:hypothetical protein
MSALLVKSKRSSLTFVNFSTNTLPSFDKKANDGKLGTRIPAKFTPSPTA